MLDLSGALRGAGETPPRQLAVCRRNQQVEGIEIEFNHKLTHRRNWVFRSVGAVILS
jgi:hypothetical protein